MWLTTFENLHQNHRVKFNQTWHKVESYWSVTRLWKETSIFDPYLTPGMKIKTQKPYCISTRHTQSYHRVSFFYYLKFRWSLSEGLIWQKTSLWLFEPHMNPGGKKIWILSAHLQDMPNHILEYELSTHEM